MRPPSGAHRQQPATASAANAPPGELFLAPFDVVFSQVDVVEPDLLYITAERRSDVLTPQHVRGTPDLVIEVGSPGRVNCHAKRAMF